MNSRKDITIDILNLGMVSKRKVVIKDFKSNEILLTASQNQIWGRFHDLKVLTGGKYWLDRVRETYQEKGLDYLKFILIGKY